MPDDYYPKCRGQSFNCRVTCGDVGLAGSATTAEQKVTHDRHVIVKSNCRSAVGTARTWKDNRLFARQPMDDDIQETANDGAEDADDDVHEWRRDQAQVRKDCCQGKMHREALYIISVRLS